jgi:methylenetetrahydrofolate dehydrogenase (NADP+) / methenyltetrahydrofolate cyclohydrolase
MELIKSTGITLPGKVAAVVGRSTLVGMPVGILLEIAGCSIIGLHSESIDIPKWTKNADIIVVATGVPELVKKDWVKPGAVVIDVGISRVGHKLVGDVAYEEVKHVAGMLTPVPGGVGPMTIAMLIKNCLKACELRERYAKTPRWVKQY